MASDAATLVHSTEGAYKMHDLHFTGRPRDAALHIIANTPLTLSLDGHHTDDGTTLIIANTVDVWSILSTGERALFELLEQFAGQRSTLTIQALGHLDDGCRRAVIRGYELFLLGEERAA